MNINVYLFQRRVLISWKALLKVFLYAVYKTFVVLIWIYVVKSFEGSLELWEKEKIARNCNYQFTHDFALFFRVEENHQKTSIWRRKWDSNWNDECLKRQSTKTLKFEHFLRTINIRVYVNVCGFVCVNAWLIPCRCLAI